MDTIYKIKLSKGYGYVVPESRFNMALYKMIRETKKDSIIKEQENVIIQKDSTIKIYERRRLDDYNEIERWKNENDTNEKKVKLLKEENDKLKKIVRRQRKNALLGVGTVVVGVILKIFVFK